MNTEDRRTCPSCSNEFSGAMEFCPVCTLRKALAAGIETGGSSFNDTLMPATEQPAQRFEHYELLRGEDGNPVELGRGAMGITYKAYDIDLQCPVALKVISERYLGDPTFKRCLGIAPGQNWEQLLLRDGVCGGGNAGETDQTLRPD
jgi:hypothetical protein